MKVVLVDFCLLNYQISSEMRQVLARLDSSGISKKKLIAIFGAIVIVAVIFLYFESIYNLTHRFKGSLTVNNDPYKLNNEEKSQLDEALAEKNRNSDNKNNENATKCWQVEPFHILEPCSKCDSFAKSSLKACKLTGYRETLNCEKYGPVSRSCSKPQHVVTRQYWTFQVVSIILASVFTVIAQKRKKFLAKLAEERVRQQYA